MNQHQRTARTVGALFLIALIPNIIANEISKPILNTATYLSQAYPHKDLLLMANLLNIICGIAMIFIPIALFSLLKKEHRGLGTGYIVFRALEGVLFFFIAIKTLGFINLSESFVHRNGEETIIAQMGHLLRAEVHWATIVYLIFFCCGAMLFYTLLWKSKLLPRWIAVWGLAGVLVLSVGTVLALFEVSVFRTMPLLEGMVYFAPPIALNEFVLSLWCVSKGFTYATDVQ